jgi:hypothetical protein
MKKCFVILSALMLIAFGSCKKNQGELITKEFDVQTVYTALEVSDSFEVTVSDAINKVTVTAGKNIMPNVVVNVVNNTLQICLPDAPGNVALLDLEVVLPHNAALQSVELRGGSEFRSGYSLVGDKVEVELSDYSEFDCDIVADEAVISVVKYSKFVGDIDADDIDVELADWSNIEGRVTGVDLDLEMATACEAKLVGDVYELNLDMYRGCTIPMEVIGHKYGLICDVCKGKMENSCSANIHCDGIISVELSDLSILYYTGNADIEGSTTTGGSSIVHGDPK